MTFEKINAKLKRLAEAGSGDHYFMEPKKRKNPRSLTVPSAARTNGSRVHKKNTIQLSLF